MFGPKIPVSMADPTNYAEDAAACSCGEIYDLNVADEFSEDGFSEMMKCKSDKHGCICDAMRVIDNSMECKSENHKCLCDISVNETQLSWRCESKRHTCICDIYYDMGVVSCVKLCRSTNHNCVCSRQSLIDTKKCLSINGHECVCEENTTYMCRSTLEHPCTCCVSVDYCKNDNNHICRCKEDSPYSCRALFHLCSCSTYPDSCCFDTKTRRIKTHGCRCTIDSKQCGKGTANRQINHFCSCSNINSDSSTCKYDLKFGSDDHLCACLRKGPENCIRRKNHYLECSVHRNQWACLPKKCKNLGVRRDDYQPWMTKSERKR